MQRQLWVLVTTRRVVRRSFCRFGCQSTPSAGKLKSRGIPVQLLIELPACHHLQLQSPHRQRQSPPRYLHRLPIRIRVIAICCCLAA